MSSPGQQRLSDLFSHEEAPSTEELYKEAMAAAGRLLARRPYSTKEVRDRLARKYEAEVTDQVVERLTELRLLDDEAFALQWARERSTKKGSRVLRFELSGKGIDGPAAESALAEVQAIELQAATRLAERHLRKVMAKPLAHQAGSIRQMLIRRGFEGEIADEATKAVLPPEGWD